MCVSPLGVQVTGEAHWRSWSFALALMTRQDASCAFYHSFACKKGKDRGMSPLGSTCVPLFTLDGTDSDLSVARHFVKNLT